MLWKQLNPSYRRLLSRGQQGEAVVADAKDDRSPAASGTGGIYGWNVTIGVKFADGSIADFERYIGANDADTIRPGMIVPIRFDPEKRSRVEIDVDALRAKQAVSRSQGSAQVEAAVQQAAARIQPIESDPSRPGRIGS